MVRRSIDGKLALYVVNPAGSIARNDTNSRVMPGRTKRHKQLRSTGIRAS
jgi:hypothetical protein